MNILILGSQGFICSYLCDYFLSKGHKVFGIDNYSKYGKVVRNHDSNPNFTLFQWDLTKDNYLYSLLVEKKIDYVINAAAKIGGISYFHEFAYDLLATNERIQANTFDAAIKAWQAGTLKKIVTLSSSMVFESATNFPSKEDDVNKIPPPISSYGFQKLATEYFAKAAYQQYGLPYTVVRPFNAVGIGEDKAISSSSTTSGNVKLTLSHVLPDLIIKVLSGQNPLHILGSGQQARCYTNGKDIARGIYLATMSEKAHNETFNISTPIATTVLELAEMVWKKIRTDEFKYVCDRPFEHDVQFRLPDTTKAKELLGFEAQISLDESIDEVVDYISKAEMCR